MSESILKNIHTAGRVQVNADGFSIDYAWPGIYFEANFEGSGIGIHLADQINDFDVFIDGIRHSRISRPGETTVWIKGLANGRHALRLVKRTESTSGHGSLKGLVPEEDGRLLEAPAPRTRQIEFIGDSFTAGYGNESPGPECTPEDVARYTNADISFGALTARRHQADYRLNAYSGLGMVRNYDGGSRGVDFRTFYDRVLINDAASAGRDAVAWHPQIVVIGLGLNDFSTPLQAGEPFTHQGLVENYISAYKAFIAKLRAHYGPHTAVVVSATRLPAYVDFPTVAQSVVEQARTAGDAHVYYFYYNGLDNLGCQAHPSARDHRLIAEKLDKFLDALPDPWQGK